MSARSRDHWSSQSAQPSAAQPVESAGMLTASGDAGGSGQSEEGGPTGA